ncbi:MAG: DEAD/DEAH box helicase, partial [Phycisphaerales bacterium]|nr:DEAD/DEAH box helicase [Phycisphaerales bacterium]
GKTLAYLLPVFCRIAPDEAATQLVILAPTHELAIQIQRQCGELAVNAGWAIRSMLLVGGTSMERQLEKLKKKPHVVIGTLGRIHDLLDMGKLKVRGLRALVIDEADRMWVPENLPALRALIAAAPASRQLIFASATPPEAGTTAFAAVAPELTILRAGEEPVNQNIEHFYLVCEERDKFTLLRKLLHALRPERAMVFVNQTGSAEDVAERLAHHKVPAGALDATGHKFSRKEAMEDFRSGRVPVLVASDVGARGLDIAGVTHVINLDAPGQSMAYLHRVGRSARGAGSGQAVTLVTDEELRLIRRYEGELGILVQAMRLREGQMIAAGEEPHRRGRDK